MTQETQEYLQSWRNRISNILGSHLNSIFDRFSTYYLLYNRFYNDSFRILQETNQLTKPRYSDFEKGTSLVVLYNSADDIVDRLTANNNIRDVEIVARLIENDIFSINLADGQSQRDLDLQLMNNLRSENNEIKAQAILSLIYNVRSNLQHGEKHFEQHQRLLLEPLIRILQTIVALQEEKLS